MEELWKSANPQTSFDGFVSYTRKWGGVTDLRATPENMEGLRICEPHQKIWRGHGFASHTTKCGGHGVMNL